MTLNLAKDELEVVRTALLDYAGKLRERAHQHCANYSPVGIDLCRTRIRVESLLDRLNRPSPEPDVMPKVAGALSFATELPKRPA